MHCADEKELLLLYYKEIPDGRRAVLLEHINTCATCKGKYQNITSCLEKLDTSRLHLDNHELENIMARVHEKLGAATAWQVFREKIVSVAATVRMGVLYRPQLIPALIVLLLVLSVVPFSIHRQHESKEQFDILQIQMELSLEDDGVSIFDLYGEASLLYEETSRRATSVYG